MVLGGFFAKRAGILRLQASWTGAMSAHGTAHTVKAQEDTSDDT